MGFWRKETPRPDALQRTRLGRFYYSPPNLACRVAELGSLDGRSCHRNIPMKTRRLKYDLAYGCFLFCGLTALFASLMEIVPMDEGTAMLLGRLVALPLILGSLVALVARIVLCVRLWKHWPLVILSGMSVLLIARILTQYGGIALFKRVAIVYSVGVVAISGLWFLALRRRHFPAASPAAKP